MCDCAGCKPKTAKARAAAAIRMLMTQRHLGRPFEHCFECADDDDVLRFVVLECKARPELAERVRTAGYGYWLDPDYAPHLWTIQPHPFAELIHV